MKSKRDLSDQQFREAMAKHGWTKPDYQFLGYWQHRSGLHASTWNYRTNREALKALAAIGERHEAKGASRPARIAASTLLKLLAPVALAAAKGRAAQ